MNNSFQTDTNQEWLTELNRLQNRLLTGKDTPEHVIHVLLLHIACVSASQYAFVVKARQTASADHVYECIAVTGQSDTQSIGPADTSIFQDVHSKSLNLKFFLDEVAHTHKPLIFNNSDLAGLAWSEFSLMNACTHLAIVPLCCDHVLSGLLILCNNETAYEEESLQLLQADFSTCAAICLSPVWKTDLYTNDLFSLLIQNSSDIVTILKEDGTIAYESPSFYKLFGYERSEVIGKNVFTFLHPEDVESVVAAFTKCLQIPGQNEPVEFRFASASGTYIILEAIGNNLLGNEAVKGIIINSRNITERKKIEMELRNSKAHKRALLDSFPLADFLIDKEYRILKLNAVARQYIEMIWEKQAQEGDNMLDYFNPADVEAFKKDFANAYAGHKVHHEHEICYPNGLSLWFEVQYVPVYNMQGQIYAVSFIAHNITVRKKNELELKKLSLVARYTDNAVIITDKNGIIEWVNEGFTRITGFSFQEAVNKKPGKLLQGPLTEPDKVRYMSDCIAAGEGFKTEIVNYHKNGSPYWLSISVSPVYDEAGKLSQFIAIESDITARKHLEHNKLEVELSLQHAFSQLQNYKNALDRSALVSIKGLDGKLLHVNEFFCKTSKYTQEELLGKHYAIVHAEYHSRAFYANMWQTLETGKIWRGEIKNVAKDGSYFWVDTIINPIQDEHGQLVQYLTIMYEITGRKKAEEKIRESESFLKDTQHVARIGNWEIRLQENRLVWSDEVFLIHGLDRSEGTPALQNLHSLYHPEDFAMLEKEARIAQQAGGVYNVDVRLLLPDGSIKYANIIGKPIQQPDGKVLKIRGTIMDIEDRKKNELRLEKQNEELKKLNAELDSFVYSVSHNLRAPLTSILGLINIARISSEHENLLNYLSMMEKSIHKLDATIHEINDYSKNARLEVQKELIDFHKLIGGITENLAYMEGASSIDIQCQADTILPFYSDKSRLQVIFNNLLSNAIKYHDLSKPAPYIRIKVMVNQSCACITIEDNGSGIAPQYKEKVFDMFYRASTHSTGSGLGLYIVKESVSKLKGTITVESQPGQGSTFIMILPH